MIHWALILAGGFAVGWLAGNIVGFYFGRRLERMRIARGISSSLIAASTSLDIVTKTLQAGKIAAAKAVKEKKVIFTHDRPPGNVTKH